MKFTKAMVFVGTSKGTRKSDGSPTRNATFNFSEGEEENNFKFYVGEDKLMEKIDKLKKFHPYVVVMDMTTYQDNINVRLQDVIDPNAEEVQPIAEEVQPVAEQQQLTGMPTPEVKSNVANALDPQKGAKR